MPPALEQTFSTFAGSLSALTARSKAELVADSWRHAAVSVEESLRFIRQHLRTLDEADARLADGSPRHGATYLASVAEILPWRIERYRVALRAVSEAEAEMTALGIAFALSSDHWQTDATRAARMGRSRPSIRTSPLRNGAR